MEECVKTYLNSMESEKAKLWSEKKEISLAYMGRRLSEIGRLSDVKLHTGYSISQF